MSAFLVDQVPDEEKFLVLGKELTAPAQNWHSKLSRTTRRTWKYLLQGFMIQLGKYGVSNATKYTMCANDQTKPQVFFIRRIFVH